MKKDFPVFTHYPEMVFLDTAASSQKPRVVLDDMRNFYETSYANIHRGGYFLSEEATRKYENARKHIASFFSVFPQEIVFVSNATHAFNLIAIKFPYEEFDITQIIVPVSEHHSNFLPFLQSAKEKGITFTVCPCDQYGKVDILELSKLLKAKKSFVSCAHITNTLGTVQDIKSITELVHRYDGIIGIDGSQSCAHLPIHLSSLDVDFFVGAGHKMYGPTGASFFFMKENFLKTLSPLFLGGGIGEDVFFDSYTLKKYPTVFEAGTPPIAEVIGLSSAVSYLESFGMDFVFAHMKSMTEKLRETLAVIPSVEILSPQDSLGIVSFRIKNESVFDTADFLAENNVCVRVGKHCAHPFVENTIHQSFLRMSVGIYTTKEDINKVGDLLGRDFCKRN